MDVWLIDIDNLSLSFLENVPQNAHVYTFGNRPTGSIRLSLEIFEKILAWKSKDMFFMHFTKTVQKNGADFLMCIHAGVIVSDLLKQSNSSSVHICSKDKGFCVLESYIETVGKGKITVARHAFGPSGANEEQP